jgi:Putative transposase
LEQLRYLPSTEQSETKIFRITKTYHQRTAPTPKIPGLLSYRQFSEWQNILPTDGCFLGTGALQDAPVIVRKDLKEIFRHKVFKMLLSEGKITEGLVRMLMSWRHSGFNVISGPWIYPREETAIENLARYVIRASFSQERVSYVEKDGIVVCRSKDGAEQKVFDALEWLAAICSHVPDKGEQMVRCYGYYSDVSRGKRNKENQNGFIPCILEADVSKKKYQKN